MIRLLILGWLTWCIPCTATIAEDAANVDDQSTHVQTRTIEIPVGKSTNRQVNAFCLNAKGQILAACGSGPGEILVINDQGELLRSWEIAIKPEAIGSASDGTVLAGGEGKLFRFSANGKLLTEVDAPHAEALRNDTETMRKEAIAVLDRSRTSSSVNSLRSRVATYERVIEQLEEKDELTTQEKQMLEVLPATLATWKEQLAEAEESEESNDKRDEPKGPSENAIAAQIESMIKSKMRIASISTNGSAVFVATRAKTGYGFAVWKLDKAMTGGEEIVTNLSGCCGQMDVQANENGLFVAENSRKRVVCYDANGDEIRAWGKADRTGLDGFTSCCNPMNVCFNAAGDVFTAESNTGRIKRFSADGEFLNFVGDVKLVPGCKNVSIAVTPDHSKVFMLDITRNHIVVMEAKSESKSKPGEKARTSRVTLSK